MSDNNDNSGWLLILFFIMLLGPCQSTQTNESNIEDNERDIQALEEANSRLEDRIKELEHWRDSR